VRSCARADLAIRVVFVVGLAIGITGIAIVSKSKVLGIALALAGFVTAGFGPTLVSGPDSPKKPTDPRGWTHD
jgi:hypothetical protein